MTDQGAQIEYLSLVQDAMRQVVYTVMERTAREGLPGEHHFYIGFVTSHPGVSMAPWLRASYPEEMTIVIQHQYRDLEVDDEGFSVTLGFGGKFDRLSVPWDAMVSFYDPAVQFVLRFEAQGADDLAGALDEDPEDGAADDGGAPVAPIALHTAKGAGATEGDAGDPTEGRAEDHDTEDEDAPSAEVVSLEAFRRK